MIIINQQPGRKLYAFKEVTGKDADGNDRYEFFLSPFEQAMAGRRPIARFDDQQQLEAEAINRGCQVVWQTS